MKRPVESYSAKPRIDPASFTQHSSYEEYYKPGGVVPVVQLRKISQPDGSVVEVLEKDELSTKIFEQALAEAKKLFPEIDWNLISIEQLREDPANDRFSRIKRRA
ncbi:MAG: hypothetical protein FWD89_04345 [Firmicutes bacterium]|nr:hypothetical protein [Bacillota bacterium]MCL2771512.1 hypothetical protein [Bacillota bacterium]